MWRQLLRILTLILRYCGLLKNVIVETTEAIFHRLLNLLRGLAAILEARYVLEKISREELGYYVLEFANYKHIVELLLKNGAKIVKIVINMSDGPGEYPWRLYIITFSSKTVEVFWKFKLQDHNEVSWKLTGSQRHKQDNDLYINEK